MLRRNHWVPLAFFAVIFIAILLSAACGSSGSNGLSQAQAQAVSHEVVTAAEAALTSAVGSSAARGVQPTFSAFLMRPRADQLPDCTVSGDTESCNISVSYTGNCPGGGTIGVSGAFDFTLTSGNGSDSSTLTVTPTNCSVSNLTINGNPNVTLATQINFQNNEIEFPVTATEGGGVTYGPNPSGSCSMNVTLSITSATSCTVSGTVCGQSLSGTC
jgi:hypothetical protein